jgi:hypothetical protein
MKRILPGFLLLLTLTIGLHTNIQAQEEQYESMQSRSDTGKVVKDVTEKKWDWSRARIGGNFGLQFGDVVYVDISPSFGYYVIENKLQVGLGFKNIYYNQKRDYFYYIGSTRYVSPGFKTFLYGPSVFLQYNVWKGLFVHGEYELINKEPYYRARYPEGARINVSHLLLGGGFTQPMGKAGNFYLSLLYNVLDGDESIYTGTFGALPLILRMGFGFGIPGR